MYFKSEKDKYIFSRICTVTNTEYSVRVNAIKYELWRNGDGHIQNVLPELSPEQREFLISGTTPAEWNQLFEF